jgi:hypothetical protein
MTEFRQTISVKNHKVMVNLPKDFNYKLVNVIITPYEDIGTFSFKNPNFFPIDLKNKKLDYAASILRDERDLI